MAWTELVPGTLWTEPVDEDTLKAKADELGVTVLDTMVTAFAQHRYVVGKDRDGRLVMLMASADDTFGLFQSRPV